MQPPNIALTFLHTRMDRAAYMHTHQDKATTLTFMNTHMRAHESCASHSNSPRKRSRGRKEPNRAAILITVPLPDNERLDLNISQRPVLDHSVAYVRDTSVQVRVNGKPTARLSTASWRAQLPPTKAMRLASSLSPRNTPGRLRVCIGRM